MARRRYTPKLKAQVVLEVLAGDRTPGQIAKAYGVHPNSGGALEAALHRAGAGDLQPRKGRSTSTSVGSGTWNSCWAGRKWRPCFQKFLGPERLSVKEKVVTGASPDTGPAPSPASGCHGLNEPRKRRSRSRQLSVGCRRWATWPSGTFGLCGSGGTMFTRNLSNRRHSRRVRTGAQSTSAPRRTGAPLRARTR